MDLLRDPGEVAFGRVKFGLFYSRRWMFKEAFDTLKMVNVKLLDNEARKGYYFLRPSPNGEQIKS